MAEPTPATIPTAEPTPITEPAESAPAKAAAPKAPRTPRAPLTVEQKKKMAANRLAKAQAALDALLAAQQG